MKGGLASLLIGLGATGAAIASEVVAYSQSTHIRGIGVGYTLEQTGIRHVTLQSDLDRYLQENKNKPHLRWFTSYDIGFAPGHRQWTRLAFFQHINHQRSLIEFVRSDLAELGGAATIHIISSLHEPESAVLLDTAIVVRRIINHHLNTNNRVRGHLVIPSPVHPSVFATLREIRRFSRYTHGYSHPIDYAEQSTDKVLNGRVEKVFDWLQIYTESAVQPYNWIQLLTNTLLIQLDPEFGNHLAGNDENVGQTIITLQMTDRANDRVDELYVGIRQANTLQFPRHQLQPWLTQRMIKHSLSIWLGKEKRLTDRVLSLWATHNLFSETVGYAVNCPGIVSEGILAWLKGDLAGQMATLDTTLTQSSADNLLKRYVPSPETNAGAASLYNNLYPRLLERPSSIVDTLSSGKKPKQVYRDIVHWFTEFFGPLSNHEPHEGIVLRDTQRFQQWHIAYYTEGLQGLAECILNRPIEYGGLETLHLALTVLIEILHQLNKTINKAFAYHKHNALTRFPNVEDELQIRAQGVTQIYRRRLFGQELDGDFQSLLDLADQIRDQFLIEIILQGLQQQVATFIQQTQTLQKLTQQWTNTLLNNPQSLWKQSSLKPDLDYMIEDDTQYLLDSSWLEQQYEKLADLNNADSALNQILTNLRWKFQLDASTLTVAAPMNILPENMVNWERHNYSVYKDYCKSIVIRNVAHWDIWHYWFDRSAKYQSLEHATSKLTAHPLAFDITSSTQQLWQTYFLHPHTDELPVQRRQQVIHLADMIKQQQYHLVDATHHHETHVIDRADRFTLFISGDAIPISKFTHYERWLTIYHQQQHVSQMHIFHAEQLAAKLESASHNRHSLLRDDIVTLLEYEEHLALFLWALATDVLSSFVQQAALHVYRFQAADVFLYQLQQRQFTPQVVEAEIETVIQHEIRLWQDQNTPPPVTEVWQWAQSLKNSPYYYQQAIYAAFAHDIVHGFGENLQDEYHQQTRQAEKDFIEVLLHIVTLEKENKRIFVRNLVRKT